MAVITRGNHHLPPGQVDGLIITNVVAHPAVAADIRFPVDPLPFPHDSFDGTGFDAEHAVRRALSVVNIKVANELGIDY